MVDAERILLGVVLHYDSFREFFEREYGKTTEFVIKIVKEKSRKLVIVRNNSIIVL